MGFFNLGHRKKSAFAVFEGGGIKGLGISGALEVAEKYYRWENVAGTSAGSIIGALVAAGYSAKEIKELMMEVDYRKFKDPFPFREVPLAGPIYCFMAKLGLFQGKYIEQWMTEKLAAKGIHTFGDLVYPKARDDRYRYRLQVVTSDISRGRMVIMPRDLKYYGINPDEFPVAKAVRMSCAIPVFFAPVTLQYRNEGVERTSYFVDGGVLSNFPLWLFEDKMPRIPTIGFRLVGPDAGKPHDASGPISFLSSLVLTMMEAHDARFLEEKSLAATISIPTLGIGTTDFDISKDKMVALYQSGRDAAEDFFRQWNFKIFVQRYFM